MANQPHDDEEAIRAWNRAFEGHRIDGRFLTVVGIHFGNPVPAPDPAPPVLESPVPVVSYPCPVLPREEDFLRHEDWQEELLIAQCRHIYAANHAQSNATNVPKCPL